MKGKKNSKKTTPSNKALEEAKSLIVWMARWCHVPSKMEEAKNWMNNLKGGSK